MHTEAPARILGCLLKTAYLHCDCGGGRHCCLAVRTLLDFAELHCLLFLYFSIFVRTDKRKAPLHLVCHS